MVKVKTFTIPLKVYRTHEELDELDVQVNVFLAENAITEVISVGDSSVTDDTGTAIGLIRVVTYKVS